MVTFRQKMDSSGKIYIVKPLRQAGLVDIIEILPNNKAAVIYQAGTKIDDILESLQTIISDLKHRAKTEAEKQ
jgi:hypothetical protein